MKKVAKITLIVVIALILVTLINSICGFVYFKLHPPYAVN